LLNKVMLHC